MEQKKYQSEKRTQELEEILKSTHLNGFEMYNNTYTYKDNEEKMSFFIYIKELLKEKKITQQKVFEYGDIPEKYGYKLLSGEKRTKQRDIILRICYAGKLTLEETQRALKKYNMPELYAKKERDALLMIIFNERPGDLYKVNELLGKYNMEPLRMCGTNE